MPTSFRARLLGAAAWAALAASFAMVAAVVFGVVN